MMRGRLLLVIGALALFAACVPGDFPDANAQGYGGGDGWQPCARENGFCRVGGTATVRYGYGGRWSYRTVNGGVPCTNQVFGDPAYGAPKECWVQVAAGPPQGSGGGYGGGYGSGGAPYGGGGGLCAREGGWCAFNGTRRVRYGANGRFAFQVINGGIHCTNEAFGGDPAPYQPKACWVD